MDNERKRNIQKELLDLINHEKFRELEKYYSNRTIMDILEVSRNENKHSNFIKWLFSCSAEHGLGDYALKKLLETICFIESKRKIIGNSKSLKWIKAEDIISGNYMLEDIIVEREKVIEKNRRIDIYIEFSIQFNSGNYQKAFIVIENKIDSSEGRNQSDDYYKWAKKYAEDNSWEFVCIFLSPQAKKEYQDYLENGKSNRCSCENFIQMNYQYLVDGIIEPCILRIETNEYKLFLENYIRCLSQPSIDLENSCDNKNNNEVDIDITIMAVGKKEKSIARIIWEDNKNILKSIIASVCGIKHDLQFEDQALLKQFYNKREIIKPILFVLTLILDTSSIEDREYYNMVNAIFMNKISINFKGKDYIKGGKKKDSFGWLGRDMIEEFNKINPSERLENFITRIRENKWSSPWLDEIIVPKSEWSDNFPRRHDHFFEESEGIINWNNEDIYVARYWTKEDILVLSDLLKMKDSLQINIKF